MTCTALPRKSWAIGAAVVFILGVFLVIIGDVIRLPTKHTTMPTYRLASTQWWAG